MRPILTDLWGNFYRLDVDLGQSVAERDERVVSSRGVVKEDPKGTLDGRYNKGKDETEVKY